MKNKPHQKTDAARLCMVSDHLGLTSLTTDVTGQLVSQARYTPFGGLHWESGAAVTDFGFTGQRADSYIKLLDYGARWYDARLGRFISADSIIPGMGNPMAYDRFSYAFNNPFNYVDPSGHIPCSAKHAVPGECTEDQENDPIQGGTPIEEPVKGRELEDWELKLLILIIATETSATSGDFCL